MWAPRHHRIMAATRQLHRRAVADRRMHSRACQAPTPYRRLTASPCQAAGSHSRQRRCSLASLRDPFTMYSSRIRYFVHHKVRHRLDLETRTSISLQSQKNMIHSSQHAPALARPRLGVRTITLFLLRCIRGGSNEEFASHTICCRPPFTWRSFASVHSERERMCV